MFENEIVGGAIPKEYINSVDQGIQEAMESGVLAGFPVVDVKVTLIDGSYHEVDSSEMSFKVAGSMAIKNAMQKAGAGASGARVPPVEVVTPEEYMGDVMGDLNSRRGRIEGMEARGNAQVIAARVPPVRDFGYATDVRSHDARGAPPTRCSSSATRKFPSLSPSSSRQSAPRPPTSAVRVGHPDHTPNPRPRRSRGKERFAVVGVVA